MTHLPIKAALLLYFLFLCFSCEEKERSDLKIIDLKGLHSIDNSLQWLTHEHILVDFIGADSIKSEDWNKDSVITQILPLLKEISEAGITYFVDATPAFLGRDVELLEKCADLSGLRILTNTGFYGARDNKYVPSKYLNSSPQELADLWIGEFENGIDGSSIRPGFMKIGVDSQSPLKPMHSKLVEAAALTHLQTGLTIASHTGKAKGMWPQLQILKESGVAPEAFIWVHAQAEEDLSHYIRAAEEGLWISLDGLGWETKEHIERLVFAKKNGILDHILLSHDAGWYDPQKTKQEIKPYSNLFKEVIPKLHQKGFTISEINLLTKINPSKAFGIEIRQYDQSK